jgi:parallel beta-helix repeat protein
LFLSNNNNTLINNNASNNWYGIYLRDSSNNIIYNNIFNNTHNTIFEGTNIGNIWNITKTAGPNIIGGPFLGGNYWSDYGSVDTDGDSIGAMPHEMDANNTDYLPLCLITHNPYDENEDYVIDIGEVNVAIDDYRTQGPTSIADVSELIDLYRSGVPYC